MPTLPMHYPTLCAAALIVAAASPAPALAQASSLSFISEPGDPIGQGQALTLTEVETARISESHISVLASNADQWFYLILTAPEGETLKRGRYEDATVVASEPVAGPGLLFYGNNIACESIEGRFEIDEIRFAAFGYVERLRAHFEQRCDGSPATLWGDVIVDNPPMPDEMKLRVIVGSQAMLVDEFGTTEARPYITVACEYLAGGRVIAMLEQSLGDAGVARGQIYDQAGCSPTAQRIYLPMTSDELRSFRPGQATLTVEVRMEDPNYAEYETDAEVVRQLTRKIRLRE